MRVKQLCSRYVVTVERSAALVDAAALMRARHVGAVVIVEARADKMHPIGILTDRDIVVAVVGVPGARMETLTAGDLMSTRLAVAHEEDGVLEAVRAMAEHGVRRLPVVDGEGALCGIITADDLQRAIASEMANLAAALEHGAEREALQRRLDRAVERR